MMVTLRIRLLLNNKRLRKLGSLAGIIYTCDYCDYTGQDKSNYNRHLKKKHDTVAPKTEAKKTGKLTKQITKVKRSGMTLSEFRALVFSSE